MGQRTPHANCTFPRQIRAAAASSTSDYRLATINEFQSNAAGKLLVSILKRKQLRIVFHFLFLSSFCSFQLSFCLRVVDLCGLFRFRSVCPVIVSSSPVSAAAVGTGSEAQFTLAGVHRDATYFNHALFGLNEETIELIFDVLEDCS